MSHMHGADRAACELALARLVKRNRTMGADALARMTTDAPVNLYARLAGSVLLHLARTATAAHAEVLHGAAKACLLMPLEMRERDDDIGIHERVADLCLFHVLAALDGNECLIGALKTIGNDHMAACGIGRKAVLIGAVNMLERVFAAAHIERVTVGEERLSAELLHHIGDSTSIVGAQK